MPDLPSVSRQARVQLSGGDANLVRVVPDGPMLVEVLLHERAELGHLLGAPRHGERGGGCHPVLEPGDLHRQC